MQEENEKNKVLILDEGWYIIVNGKRESLNKDMDIIKNVTEMTHYRRGEVEEIKLEYPLDLYINKDNNCLMFTKKRR